MGINQEQRPQMDRRALLTEREREVLQGEADDVENLAQYQSKIRTRLKRRLDRLEEDLAILETNEPEIYEDTYTRVCGDHDTRLAQLEREVQQLREQIQN